MSREMELIEHVYERFSVRDLDGVLAAMHAGVMWANGMEGGHVRGHDAASAALGGGKGRGYAVRTPAKHPMPE